MTAPARIPERGVAHDVLLAELEARRRGDLDFRGGKSWSLVYWAGDAHHALLERAHAKLMAENALNPMAFKSLHQLEREVVQMTAAMLHGSATAVGTMTSGGTESLLLAVKAYRDRARARRPCTVLRPNMVVPETAHVAFDKAGHLFGVRKKVAPVDAHGAVDVDAMARLIDSQTVMLAASAPQYPHGTVDPIPAIGALAERRGLPLHVDACFGGFVLPWLERLGVAMPAWDFRVSGVTSVSADIHKYGFGAKGASTIIYRDLRYLRHQFFVATQWPGGIYCSPGLHGTRPGGPIAAAWAAMRALGEEGYLELTRGALEAAERLRRGISAIPGLRVLGRPQSTIVSWGTDPRDDALDVYAIADRLQAAGWGVDRQQRPPGVHLTVNASNGPVVDTYLADLRAAVDAVRANPTLRHEGEAAMYGLMARVPKTGLSFFLEKSVLDAYEKLYAAEPVPSGGPRSELLERHGRALRAILGRVERLGEHAQALWRKRSGGRT